VSTDWNSGWVPPGTEPTPESTPTTTQNTGWDWSWLFPPPDPHARQGPPGGGRYGAPPKADPNDPISKWINSWGWPQADPSYELAKLIMAKEGIGPGASRDPRVNYLQRIAEAAAQRAQTDPQYREQLATSMGWNMANPHVAYWVMHGGASVPSDPTGSGLTPAQAAAAKQTAAAAPPAATIGAPFDPKAYGGRGSDPGFTYGAALPPWVTAAGGGTIQTGVDYALPFGTPLTSPFAGQVVEATDNVYGNTVMIKLSNGYTYRIGHLSAINVKVGDTVHVGQELGAVGSTGISTGPHVYIEMRDPQGKPIDPTPIVDSLLKGDTAGASKYLSDYQTAETAVGGPFLTSDGHLIYPGSQDYNVFFAAQQLWRKRYGGDPPWSFVSSLIAQGNTTTEQIQSAMDQMSSDITGMNWGQRDALTNDVNGAAQKAWDRPVPDALVKQLAALGINTPGQIQGWIQSHPASALDPSTYQQYFDAANPQTQQLWKQPPSPDMVALIHKQMQKGPQGG